MKKKVLLITMAAMLLITSTIPPKKTDAAVQFAVAGGVAAGTYVYVALALAAAYGISTFDEQTAAQVKDHALSTYNKFDATMKSAWDATVASMTPRADNIDYSEFLLTPEFNASMKSTLNSGTSARDLSSLSGLTVGNTLGNSGTKYYTYTWPSNYFARVSEDLRVTGISMPHTNGIITGAYVSFWTNSGQSFTAWLFNQYGAYPGFEYFIPGVTIDQIYNFDLSNYVTAGINKYYAEYPPLVQVDIPAGSIGLNIPKFPTLEMDLDGKPTKVGVPIPGAIPDTTFIGDGTFPVLDTAAPTTAPTLTADAPPTAGTGEYTGILGTITGWLSDIWTKIKEIYDFLKGILNSIWTSIQDAVNALLDIFGWDALVKSIETGVTSISDFFKEGLLGSLQFNWAKLKLAGISFTFAFPFSLPWDVGRAFDAVFGGFDTTNPPQWVLTLAGESWTIKMPQMLLDWFPITRVMLLILFDIGLIYSIRKLLGGAS